MIKFFLLSIFLVLSLSEKSNHFQSNTMSNLLEISKEVLTASISYMVVAHLNFLIKTKSKVMTKEMMLVLRR